MMAYGLIDEYQLLVHPIVLGSGKRLFRDGGEMTALRLVGTRTFSSGVVLLSYQPASDGGES
jgi:dihydrofolate reductase